MTILELEMEKKKKENLVKIVLYLIPLLIAWIIIIGAVVVCVWRFIMAPCWSQKLLAISVLVPIGLGVFNMLKWLRSSNKFDQKSQEIESLKKQMKKERAIEMVNNFIRPLIWDCEKKIDKISFLTGHQIALTDFQIRLDDKYAHKDVLGEDYELIKEKVGEYNNLVMGNQLEEAKKFVTNLKSEIEELERSYMMDYNIPKDKIRENNSMRGKVWRQQ